MESFRSGTRLPFSKKKLPVRVIISYVLDYVIIVVLLGGFYLLDSIEPFHQKFSLQNYTLHYPYAEKERVPVPELVIIAVGGPAVIIIIYTLAIDGIFSHQKTNSGRRRRYAMKDRLWEMNCGLLGLALSVCAAFTITGALKNAIGKPRPDLIARCIPPPDSVDPSPFQLSDHSLCTQKDNHILKDGFRSFPSGHSSGAFSGLFYISIYLAAKLHVLDSKGEVWKSFIVMVPTLGAALIAGSRIMDARHHPFDVLSGSALGMLVAWGAYRQYFPPVTDSWLKGRAYPIRSWGKDPRAPSDTLPYADDMDPLNPSKQVQDEESQPFTATSSSREGENVFRAQVTATNRNRDLQREPTDGSNYSSYPARHPTNATYSSQLPASNPFRGRGRADTWEESSAEGDDGFELRPTHVTEPIPQSKANETPYNPGFGLGRTEDTSYQSKVDAPVITTTAPTTRKPVATETV